MVRRVLSGLVLVLMVLTASPVLAKDKDKHHAPEFDIAAAGAVAAIVAGGGILLARRRRNRA